MQQDASRRRKCPKRGPFGPRPTVPHQLWRMSREEIVKTLMGKGFSRKMAERDADAFLAYRDGAKHEPSQGKDPEMIRFPE